MRECLHTALKTVGAKGNWDHIVNQNGMFSYTGEDAEYAIKQKMP